MKIAVVIPAFKVSRHILAVLSGIGAEVERIYVVDDACPEGSGLLVAAKCVDPRVEVIYNETNQGVGGAVMAGYLKGLDDGFDILVKVDGDGQMDTSLIPKIVRPILEGNADYTKGNRFDNLESLTQMPKLRLFGNAVLSFMTKFSTGYWSVSDPTNGYTAIHSKALKDLPLQKIQKRYFFESDILFRLSVIRAVVRDVPIESRYGDEVSNLRIGKVIWEFPRRHFVNYQKRIFYNYYLREMNIASLELPLGLFLFMFGLIFGLVRIYEGANGAGVASAGVVMLAAVPVILGLQLILSFLAYDIQSAPGTSRQKL